MTAPGTKRPVDVALQRVKDLTSNAMTYFTLCEFAGPQPLSWLQSGRGFPLYLDLFRDL
jgi:hypothetical protein